MDLFTRILSLLGQNIVFQSRKWVLFWFKTASGPIMKVPDLFQKCPGLSLRSRNPNFTTRKHESQFVGGFLDIFHPNIGLFGPLNSMRWQQLPRFRPKRHFGQKTQSQLCLGGTWTVFEVEKSEFHNHKSRKLVFGGLFPPFHHILSLLGYTRVYHMPQNVSKNVINVFKLAGRFAFNISCLRE